MLKTNRPVLTTLTANPCKMCMPMGAATAFMGLADSLVLLHGSQGCSTYIRRHMATHYNEPVDIASSSLTEHGTVYGGEKQLFEGLDNLIKVYNPAIIGVATTCLAETIGEDINGMALKYNSEKNSKARIVPVSTPGYSGTQYEGYFRTLYAIVKQLVLPPEKKGKHINLITSPVSPADARWLKQLFSAFELEVILLPDLSGTLDGGAGETTLNRRRSGTPIEKIQNMSEAQATIELTHFVPDSFSPGKLLQDEFGVPLISLNLPVGIQDNDALIDQLEKLSGKKRPTEIEDQRSRYLDAIIDSHKYMAEGRAVIFGEPDLVYSLLKLCCESGIVPVSCTTGSRISDFEKSIREDFSSWCQTDVLGKCQIEDDTDFQKIEEITLTGKANLLIGSSDGRRIEEKTGVALIRCGFPIHDRIGGQRLRMLGYDGSLMMLDQITNELLAAKETGFRKKVKKEFLLTDTLIERTEKAASKPKQEPAHPCFSPGAACSQGRMHLPVAPACNIQCNYCVRSFDCPNESRPGVTTKVLSPEQAADRFAEASERLGNIAVAGIAGPGDALANFEQTVKTIELVKEKSPETLICLSTNGLMLPFYADRLLQIGVTHLTVTINAIDPQIGAQIYKHIDYFGKRYSGVEGAKILIKNQLDGLAWLADKEITVKVNTVLIKGINDEHVEEVVKKVKELGCSMSNIMQMIPVKGSAFENQPMVSRKELDKKREICGEHIKQMYHCQQCRADAVGLLHQDKSALFGKSDRQESDQEAVTKSEKKIAVFSQGGWLVDQHFGQAREISIYTIRDKKPILLEKRKLESAYCQGEVECDYSTTSADKENRMANLMSVLQDCSAVVTMRIGDKPLNQLKKKGIKVITTYEPILEVLARLDFSA